MNCEFVRFLSSMGILALSLMLVGNALRAGSLRFMPAVPFSQTNLNGKSVQSRFLSFFFFFR